MLVSGEINEMSLFSCSISSRKESIDFWAFAISELEVVLSGGVMLRIVPSQPTTQPRRPSAVNCCPKSVCVVPLVSGCQCAPPSSVVRIVPPSPTTQPADDRAAATVRGELHPQEVL